MHCTRAVCLTAGVLLRMVRFGLPSSILPALTAVPNVPQAEADSGARRGRRPGLPIKSAAVAAAGRPGAEDHAAIRQAPEADRRAVVGSAGTLERKSGTKAA